ncbi:M20/M25/M40 family metallo-hydrolase [Mucilaginibacter ginkgonis]|uniref:M20/M25/M40 family metallo-hydrolase n=1 Tax=Mucilaginibacter ginkgonis TaxID=2682091 RepID=A0A6I4IN44_9SPHI|nr:M20/M25/M40 family metallo-hydrolase [Mucilaginibacter ginkgonis]QQL49289.1 M20/M25/M40 family metallo-hydrolase [Mucilaginibacter ginkgonis]
MKKNILTIGLLSLALYSSAQDVNKLIKEDDVRKVINTLAADDMQGRATFTPGIEKAAKFIESEFKKAGLEPLAGNADYRQNFKMTRVAPVNSKATIDGVSIPAENIVIQSGTALNWNNDTTVAIKHIAAGQNMIAEYRTIRRSAKKAIIIVDPSLEATFRQLQQALGHGTTSLKTPTATGPQLVFVLGAFPNAKNLTVSSEIKTDMLPLFNVAGMIKGKTKPDEYVIFSGHYDHLGIIKPMEGDSIANGADDDASGTTAVITLAHYFKKLNNNARSIIFVAFTAEEIGEYGSAYFATQVDPIKVSAMFNIEMIGKASKFGQNSAIITGYERSDFGPILQKNLEGTAFKFYPDPYKEQNLFYRSDNASLARVGVPAHTISTDQIDIDKLYHTVKDEVGSLDVANITATIRAIALSSKTIVAGTDTPTRIPPASLER